MLLTKRPKFVFFGALAGLGGLMTAAAAISSTNPEVSAAAPALANTAYVGDPVTINATLLSDDNVTAPVSSAETASVGIASSTGQNAPKAVQVASSNSFSPAPSANEPLSEELVCMAKVVRHEAANQSMEGQIAVAQILMNRTSDSRFPSSVCAAARQPGQFFDIDSYNPPRNNKQWENAVQAARMVLAGHAEDQTNGAYFYHAASQAPNRFFRTRQPVRTLGDHIFYR